MLLKFWYAPGFEVAEQASARRIASSSCSTAIWPRTIYAALREGFAAHRKYEDLRSRGISHDTALKEALGIRAPAARAGRSHAPRCDTRFHDRINSCSRERWPRLGMFASSCG
jgi:hypothetical protein